MTVFSDWQEIDTIFLDMDGTLLDLYFDNHFWLEHVPQVFARENSIPDDEAYQQLMQMYSDARGTLAWYCIDYWSDKLQLDIRSLKRGISDRIAIRPNAQHFLESINNQDKRVVMVTNAHPAAVEIKLETTGIDIHFDRIIDSHDVGLAKEQAGFWEKLRLKEEFDPARTMFIDDNLEVLQCAADYGIAYLFAIAEPDSRQGKVDAEPFAAIDDFSAFIKHL
jgi:putative hydrolase of the HAD superfamily